MRLIAQIAMNGKEKNRRYSLSSVRAAMRRSSRVCMVVCACRRYVLDDRSIHKLEGGVEGSKRSVCATAGTEREPVSVCSVAERGDERRPNETRIDDYGRDRKASTTPSPSTGTKAAKRPAGATANSACRSPIRRGSASTCALPAVRPVTPAGWTSSAYGRSAWPPRRS